jgi:hypothetical protein
MSARESSQKNTDGENRQEHFRCIPPHMTHPNNEIHAFSAGDVVSSCKSHVEFEVM